MKKLISLILLILLQSCIFLGGEREPEELSNYTPVFLNRAEFENSVILLNTTNIGNAGKIYVFNDNLFINEKNGGFHVYDNSNTTNPIPLKFINAPGATDMAIKNNTMYINQARDLIAVELSANMQSLTVTKRIRNVFPDMISPDGFYANIPEGQVLVNWIQN